MLVENQGYCGRAPSQPIAEPSSNSMMPNETDKVTQDSPTSSAQYPKLNPLTFWHLTYFITL